jgi:hypothetical protein
LQSMSQRADLENEVGFFVCCLERCFRVFQIKSTLESVDGLDAFGTVIFWLFPEFVGWSVLSQCSFV